MVRLLAAWPDAQSRSREPTRRVDPLDRTPRDCAVATKGACREVTLAPFARDMCAASSAEQTRSRNLVCSWPTRRTFGFSASLSKRCLRASSSFASDATGQASNQF